MGEEHLEREDALRDGSDFCSGGRRRYVRRGSPGDDSRSPDRGYRRHSCDSDYNDHRRSYDYDYDDYEHSERRDRDDEQRDIPDGERDHNDDAVKNLGWNKIADMARAGTDVANGMFGKPLKMSKLKPKGKGKAKAKSGAKKKAVKKKQKEKSDSSSSSESQSSKKKKKKKDKKTSKKENSGKDSEGNRVFSTVVIDQESDLEMMSGSDLEVVSCAVAQPPPKKDKKKDKKDKKEKKEKRAKLVQPVITKVAAPQLVTSMPPPKVTAPAAFKPVGERPEI